MSLDRSASIFLPILASAAYVLELSFVPLILPGMAAALQMSPLEMAGVFNVYMVAVAVAVLVGGWAGDRFDAKSVFALGVVCFVVGSAITALSSSTSMVVFGRLLQGTGGGLFSPLIPVLLKQAAGGRPGRLLILWGSLSGLLAAITPVATYLLVGVIDWALVFLLLAMTALPAAFLPLFRTRQADLPKQPFQLATSFIQPLRVWALYGYVFLSFGLVMLYVFLLPIRLTEQGYSLVQITYPMSALWLAFTVSGVLLRDHVDTARIWVILLVAPLFLSLGFMVFVTPLTNLSVVFFSAFIGFGFACSNATSTTLILQYCTPHTEAVAASLDISIARAGAVVAVALLAPLSHTVLVSMTALIAAATILTGATPLLLNRRQRRDATRS